MSKDLSRKKFEEWLRRYGDAWEQRDPQAAAALFAEDARYYWTPFQQPKIGPEGIAAAWHEATSGQRNVHFSFEVVGVAGATGIARWHTALERLTTTREVELDGVLLCEFVGQMRCRVFREWWHSTD